MLDLKHYAEKYLTQEDRNIYLKYFSKVKYKSIFSLRSSLNNPDSLSWIKNIDDIKKLQAICLSFSSSLKENEELSSEQKTEMVLEKLSCNDSILSFLEVRGSSSVTCTCPKCQDTKEKAFLSKASNYKFIVCNHRTNCGFSNNLIGAYAEYHSISYGSALYELSQELNVDFNINEVHTNNVKKEFKKIDRTIEKKVEAEKEIEYVKFDAFKKYKKVELSKHIDSYPKMDDRQKFMMIVTAIYRFSLDSKQWGKINYFKSRDISAKKHPSLINKVKRIDKEIGFLHKTDLQELSKFLLNIFPIKDLIEMGVIHDVNHKYPYSFKQNCEEGFIVIPNFDLYTNMCTGLKLRKTKLKTWFDKSKNKEVTEVKEPELSYGRIAMPLPYSLTRQALLRPETKFRFFEGSMDLFSIPDKKDYCDLAIPGVNGVNQELFGLFKGRDIEIWFDQDKAGQEGALKLKTSLELAGAKVLIKNWNMKFGSDVNEVLENGFIEKLILEI